MSTFIKDNYCRYLSSESVREECGSLWKFYLSQGNSNPDSPNDIIERSLFVFSFAGLVLMRIFYQYRFLVLDKELDEKNVDITDFSFVVCNLPSDCQEYMVKNLFTNILKKNKLSDDSVEVVRINFAFQDYQETIDKGIKIKEILDDYKRELKGGVPDTEDYYNMIHRFNEKLDELKTDMDNLYDMDNFYKHPRKKFSGVAFVTVEKEEHADLIKQKLCLKAFPKLVYSLLGYIPGFMLKVLPSTQKHLYDEENFAKGYVFIDIPKPPEDLIWENFGKGKMNNLTRKLISLIGTIIIFGITLAILVSLKFWQTNSGANFWISILFTLVIKIINEIANFFSKKLVALERINSRTMLSAELTWRSASVGFSHIDVFSQHRYCPCGPQHSRVEVRTWQKAVEQHGTCQRSMVHANPSHC